MRRTASTLIAVLLLGSPAWAHVGFEHFVKDFSVGSRVVVDARREKGVWFAKEVRFVVETEH